MDFLKKTSDYLHNHFIPSERNSYRPHSLRRDFLVSIVALVCVVEGFLATSLVLQTHAPQFSAAVLEGALISLTNTKRAAANEPALVQNQILTLAAQAKANDMAARGYFAHVDPQGREAWDWMKDAGYEYAYAGENLAAHFYDSSDVVQAWMDSPSHRENILRAKYQEIGIGIAHGTYQGVDTIFVVQFFGVTKAALGITDTKPARVAVAPAAVVDAKVTVETSAVPATAGVPVNQNKAAAVETPQPIVEGQSTNSIQSTISKWLSAPRTTAMWVLFAVLFVIALAVLLAFFIRIHIQPVDLLINGMVVAAFVLTIIATNGYFFSNVDTAGSGAAVVSALATE